MKNLTTKKLPSRKISFNGLGTDIEIWIVMDDEDDDSRAEQDLSDIMLFFENTEKIFSRFDDESELSFLNSNLNAYLPASEHMRNVAASALQHHAETGGYFDPRVVSQLENIGYDRDFKDVVLSKKMPDVAVSYFDRDLSEDLLIKDDKICFRSKMDFSGIVKGWVTDKSASILSGKGWKNFMVNSGGDIFFAGRDDEGMAWPVDIESISYEKILLNLQDVGIATSGIGKRKWEKNGIRYHHLINPKKPNDFSFDFKSVTVVAPSTEQADVLAKTLFLMGREKAVDFAKEKGVSCVILDYKGSAWISSAIKKYVYQK